MLCIDILCTILFAQISNSRYYLKVSKTEKRAYDFMVFPIFYIFEAILSYLGFLNGLFESQAHMGIIILQLKKFITKSA